MHKLWQVAVYEYRRNVFKKSFIFTLLSIPCLIAFSVLMGLFLESHRDNSQRVGVVDQAGVLNPALIAPEAQTSWAKEYDEPVSLVAFETDQAARSALDANEIQAYFILPKRYLLRRQVEVIYTQEPDDVAWRQFYDLLRASLLSGRPVEIVSRATGGTDFIVRSIDGKREVPAASGPTFGLLMPLFIAITFLAMLLISSGYIMGAVTDEKENRTMEVLVTSISSIQLIGGKILGIVAISLTLLFTWTVMVILGIFISRQVGVGWFSDLSMDWRSVFAVVSIAIPAYVLATALMAAIGAMVPTTQESQSVGGIFFALHFAPLYISLSFLSNPNHPLAVLLSVMPFTSLMTVGVRNLFTIVPAWQVAVSAAMQVVCALAAIWVASRVFRSGMLHYGHRLNVWHLLGRV
jgi:ABC-2 type transport system permease protein